MWMEITGEKGGGVSLKAHGGGGGRGSYWLEGYWRLDGTIGCIFLIAILPVEVCEKYATFFFSFGQLQLYVRSGK